MTEVVPATTPAAPSGGRRRERRAPQAAVRQLPFARVFNRYPPIGLLSADQIEAILATAIAEGAMRPGQPIGSSEHELAGRFNVSRATVRRALARLHARGLITRQRFDGTRVAEHRSNARRTA